MKISSLEITHFRNLEKVAIDLGQKINVFYGHNGSGKTSLLEALHYLGLGRSFRTRNLNRIIHHDFDFFSLFCQLANSDGSTLPVGVERKKGALHHNIKIAGKNSHSLAELAEIVPVQFFNADSHMLLTSGSLPRRQFLDWGVFHVEPSFYHYWQRAQRIIKQRNASLRCTANYREISPWDQELDECATFLHVFRQKYFEAHITLLYPMLQNILGEGKFSLSYHPGWDTSKKLDEVLQINFYRDQQLGYTQAGPHRFDWQLKLNGILAHEILSQGQQKLGTYALRLAQGLLLTKQTPKSCIFLIDDLPSELDREKRMLIAKIISAIEAQVFITGIEAESLSDFLDLPDTRVFHVEQGKIRPQI